MNIFNQLAKSLYSPKSISHYRFQGIGKTISFVAFLTLLSVIPSFVKLQSVLTNGVNYALETIDQKIPNFTIKNGQLHSDHNDPVTINRGEVTILIDPTGSVETDDIENSHYTIALLVNDLVIVTKGEVQTYPYSRVNNLHLTKAKLYEFVNTIDSSLLIIVLLIFLVIYLFSLGIKFVEITFLALIGNLIKNGTNRKLAFRQGWRISAYCVALPTLFFMFMTALNINVPFGFYIYWIVGIIVLLLVIKEIPQVKI